MAEMLAERPATAELYLANEAIGDRAPLDVIMAEHGYWFQPI